ncbi:hypothetical protein ABZ646_46715, partial [Streptomyces sp. NPDC007162]|uniref:AraC-like ligand-binding domain-containing protein n=1 Tax=Streptomyces sp. NPDC007162 TaxID=3156917 RepID=UPI0033FF39B9
MTIHHPTLSRAVSSHARDHREAGVDSFAPCVTEVPPAVRDVSIPSVLRSVELTHMTLGVIRFDSETHVVSGPVRGYHIAVPIRGEIVCRYGSDEVIVKPGFAAVAAPDLPSLVSSWSADAEILGIKIRPDVVEDELSAMIGRTVRSVIRLSGGFDLTEPGGRSWLSVLELLLADLADPDRLA